MVLLFIYVAIALGISFLCSILEAVLLSVSPFYISALETEGRRAGKTLRELKANVDRPLASILSLNTIANTMGAAGAGAQAAVVFGDTYVGVASAVLTLLILVFSEIIPKTVGAAYWRSLAPPLAPVIAALIWIMYPLVKLSDFIIRLIAPVDHHRSLSKAELEAMVDIGAEEGAINEGESRIIRTLLRFGSLTAEDIMTPRTVVFHLAVDATVGDAVGRCENRPFSRIPLRTTDADSISGYVLRSEVLLHAARDQHDTPLRDLQRPLPVVPTSLPLPKLFDQLLQERHNMALIVDEYGGTKGIVTNEDLVETLLGMEIVDEVDSAVDMQALARAQWEKRAKRYGSLREDSEP